MFNFFKPKEVRNFEKEYAKKEFEVLVLMESTNEYSLKKGGYHRLSFDFIALVNLETNEFSETHSFLEWFGKVDEDCKFDCGLKGLKIYKVRVRKLKKSDSKNEKYNNELMIVKVLEEIESHKELDKVREHYKKEVVIKNNLGEFILDRRFSNFKSEIKWLRKTCNVILATDSEYGETADNSMEVLKKIVKDAETMEETLKKYACKWLIDLANEWCSDAGEDYLTKAQFMKRIKLYEIFIDNEKISFYFSDDDIFAGHNICVETSLEGECLDTHI